MDILEVSRCERVLFSSMKDLKDIIDEVKKFVLNNPSQNRFAVRNAHIRARLYVYLCNGVNFDEAKRLLSIDFGLSRPTIDALVGTVHSVYLKNIKPHRIYATHKLKKAGLNNKKIAEILDITPATVSKYLRIKQILE